MKIYKINPNATSSLAFQDVLGILGMMTGMLIIIFVWLSTGLTAGASIWNIIGKALPGFLLIFGLIAVVMTAQKSNFYGSTRFLLTEDTIATVLDNGELNTMNQFGVARNRSRYGAEPNQVIPFSHISHVNITDKSIKIYSRDYSFLNGNGRIKIPKQTEQFEELKQVFQRFA